MKEPDIAGVITPSDNTIAVPKSTMTKTAFFKQGEDSRHCLTWMDLSSSFDGTFSWKLDMCVSGGNWIGIRLILAFLEIKEYRANMPPAKILK